MVMSRPRASARWTRVTAVGLLMPSRTLTMVCLLNWAEAHLASERTSMDNCAIRSATISARMAWIGDSKVSYSNDLLGDDTMRCIE